MPTTPAAAPAGAPSYLPERLRDVTAQARELLRDFRESVMVRDLETQATPNASLSPAATDLTSPKSTTFATSGLPPLHTE